MKTKSYLGAVALLVLFAAPARAETPAEGPAAASLPKIVAPQAYRHLTGRLVTGVVRRYRRAIGRCYDRSLKRDREIEGRLDILVTVRPDGRVQTVQLETKKFAGSPLAVCIERSIAGWRFPAFAGETPQDVLLPFSLRPPLRRSPRGMKVASR